MEEDFVDIDINEYQSYEKHQSQINWTKACADLKVESLTQNFLSIKSTDGNVNNYKYLFEYSSNFITSKKNENLGDFEVQLKVAFNVMMLTRNTWKTKYKEEKEADQTELNTMSLALLQNEVRRACELDCAKTQSFNEVVDKIFATNSVATNAVVLSKGNILYRFTNLFTSC